MTEARSGSKFAREDWRLRRELLGEVCATARPEERGGEHEGPSALIKQAGKVRDAVADCLVTSHDMSRGLLTLDSLR